MNLFRNIFRNKINDIVNLNSNQSVDWKDLVFTITEKEKLSNGYWNLVCKAKIENEIVGIRIKILDDMPAGIVNDELVQDGFTCKGVEFESIGEESDKLVERMALLFEMKKKTKFTSNKLTFTVFSLNNKKANLNKGKFKFKIFYDDDNDLNLYSEFYLNLNFKNGIIEINEKDSEYRKNIITFLSKN